jgi:predicted Zn-dependent protease with MMP-like domain
MNPREFDELVERALAKVPRRFRARMRNLAIVVETEPSEGQLHKLGGSRGTTLLGLYEGRPLTERSVSDGFTLPDRITLFQGPHERLARSPDQLRELVEDTVWHEVAHYFGMDERQVRAAERRRLTWPRQKRV